MATVLDSPIWKEAPCFQAQLARMCRLRCVSPLQHPRMTGSSRVLGFRGLGFRSFGFWGRGFRGFDCSSLQVLRGSGRIQLRGCIGKWASGFSSLVGDAGQSGLWVGVGILEILCVSVMHVVMHVQWRHLMHGRKNPP